MYGTRGTHCKFSLLEPIVSPSLLMLCLNLNTAASISHCVQIRTKMVVTTAGKRKLPYNGATFKYSEVRLQCNACQRFFQILWKDFGSIGLGISCSSIVRKCCFIEAFYCFTKGDFYQWKWGEGRTFWKSMQGLIRNCKENVTKFFRQVWKCDVAF